MTAKSLSTLRSISKVFKNCFNLIIKDSAHLTNCSEKKTRHHYELLWVVTPTDERPVCAGMTCHFNSPVVDLHSKSLDMSLPSRSNFLHVHAVLSKNLAEQKYF